MALHSLTPDALQHDDLIHLGDDWVSVQSSRQCDTIADGTKIYFSVVTVDSDGGWYEDFIDADRRLAVYRD